MAGIIFTLIFTSQVPNHTSDEHEWFKKSVDRDPEFDEYYVWHNGKENPNGGRPLPPNNWVSSTFVHCVLSKILINSQSASGV